MSHHFDGLRSEIPLKDASDFFLGLKKYAEWSDPPDMTGELEGQFTVPVEEVLTKLKQVISNKFRKAIAYWTYAQCFRGPWWRGTKTEFEEHAAEEQKGAEFYLKRAVALGGPVHMDPIEPPPPSNNPLGILKTMKRAEQEAIAAQRELLCLVGPDNPMRIGIEEQLAHDQHHLDETSQLMTQEQQAELEGAGVPEMMEEPPPELAEDAVEGEEELEVPDEEPAEEEELEAPAEELPEEDPVEEEAPPAELEELPKAASMRMMAMLEKQAKSWKLGPVSVSTGEDAEKTVKEFKEHGYYGESENLAPVLTAGLARSIGAGVRFKDKKKTKKAAEKVASMRLAALLEKQAMGPGESQMASPTANEAELQPQNYLAAEMQAQQAQDANEANFYREQLSAVHQENQAMQQQMMEAQQQLQQMQMQTAETGQHVQQAINEAQMARDEAVQQSMEAAKARIGAQKMRMAFLDIASQDPAQLGEQALAPQPMDAAMGGDPMADPSGMAPDPAAPPGAAPPEGGDPAAAAGPPPPPGGDPAAGGAPPEAGPPGAVKAASFSPALTGALIGGAGGAGLSLLRGRGKEGLDAHQAQLEANQNGGFRQASALAAAKKDVADAELSRSHPGMSALKGGLAGAVTGAMVGPSLSKKVPEIIQEAPMAGKALLGMIRR